MSCSLVRAVFTSSLPKGYTVKNSPQVTSSVAISVNPVGIHECYLVFIVTMDTDVSPISAVAGSRATSTLL
jgi:hypothetical protein